MTSASSALRASVHAALAGDASLTTLLGGAKIYDEVPRGAEFPYVTFGDSRATAMAADGEAMEEHLIVLHAWSRQGGRYEAQIIAGALLQALDDASLALAGHHLVNLRFSVADIRREADGRTYRALVRFRAVTEPQP